MRDTMVLLKSVLDLSQENRSLVLVCQLLTVNTAESRFTDLGFNFLIYELQWLNYTISNTSYSNIIMSPFSTPPSLIALGSHNDGE